MIQPEEQSLVLDTKRLIDTMERNPYAVVAGAIGVGFVLGGGLFTRLTSRIVNVALRLGVSAVLPQLTEELLRSASEKAGGSVATPKNGERKAP